MGKVTDCLITFFGLLGAVACGSDRHGGSTVAQGFSPAPPGADERQIRSPVIQGIAPGSDVLMCSFFNDTATTESDVSSYTGYTTLGSHHAILYGVATPVAAGTHECTTEEIMGSLMLIAGIGDEASSGTPISLPQNLVRRIPAHTQLMIQSHWLNGTEDPIDGEAAFNVKFAAPSPDKTPTDFASVMSTDFTLPPGAATHVTTDCVFPKDVSLWQLAGHQHALGTHIKISLTRAGGTPETLVDEDWLYHWALDPNFIDYTDAPLVIHQGDTVSVACDFTNTESKAVQFPHEMCGAIGQYYPSNGQVLCFNGAFNGG